MQRGLVGSEMCIRDRVSTQSTWGYKKMGEKSASIVVCEMPESMRDEAVTQAKMAIDKQGDEKQISEEIKRYFDRYYFPNWHCVVGKNFSYFVSYEAKQFIFFYVGQIAVLLYKLQSCPVSSLFRKKKKKKKKKTFLQKKQTNPRQIHAQN
eukprot:TRINITY_DN3367_c0_g1_i2.p2 TRINITY_DN3367_c0_g1~~TRINITY_DN3367_c0_g1_i2.p2  ORF type:complete len:151 (+),score=36.43 TRINITY_DN3367_c0_g1_i2:134-586(+)